VVSRILQVALEGVGHTKGAPPSHIGPSTSCGEGCDGIGLPHTGSSCWDDKKDVRSRHSFLRIHLSILVSIHCLSRRIHHGRIDACGSADPQTKPSYPSGRTTESQFPSIQDET
jgi:hypothetical protein